MNQKQTSVRKLLLLIFFIAFALNFVWEMLQMPAYGRFAQSAAQMWLFCTLATTGDAVYISLLYWIGKSLTQDQIWIAHLDWLRVSAIIVVGIISATLVERIALTFGFWQYSEVMIEVPLLQVGILPMLQLTILPLATFWLVKQATKSKDVLER